MYTYKKIGTLSPDFFSLTVVSLCDWVGERRCTRGQLREIRILDVRAVLAGRAAGRRVDEHAAYSKTGKN